MDSTTESSKKGKIISELRRAIRNINRNLYEWKDRKAGKTNFSISYTEVYGVTRNWLIRCLRNAIGFQVADRIFRRGHLYLQINESLLCIESIRIDHNGLFDRDATLVKEILDSIDFKSLRYDPKDYMMDGVTQKPDFSPYIDLSFDEILNFKF